MESGCPLAPSRSAGAGAGPGGLPPGGSKAALLDVARSPVASAVVGLSVSVRTAKRERGRTHADPPARSCTVGCDNHDPTQLSATADQQCQKSAASLRKYEYHTGHARVRNVAWEKNALPAALEGSGRPTRGLTVTAYVGLVTAVVHDPRGFS